MRIKIFLVITSLVFAIGCSKKEKKYLPFSMNNSVNAPNANASTNVTGATLSQIRVSPETTSIALNTHANFTATGVYSDGTTKDITQDCDWSVKTETDKVSNVSSKKGRFLGSSATSSPATISAASGSISGDANLTVTNATLQSIQISSVPNLTPGGSVQYIATGIFSDGTTQDVSSLVTWSSSNSSSVTINPETGVGTGGSSVGMSTITATLTSPSTFPSVSNGGSSTTNTALTSVAVSSITVTGAATVGAGLTTNYYASVLYTDGTSSDITTQATWSTANTTTASVNNNTGSKGIVTGIAAGTNTVQVSYLGLTGSKNITVSASLTVSSVSVSPSSKSFAKGTTTQFTATATYSDGSTADVSNSAVWSSSNNSIATVNTSVTTGGLAQAVAVGSATITASTGGKSGTASATVTAAVLQSIAIDTNASVAKGTTKQFTAIGTYSDGSTLDITTSVTWSSSSTPNVTVSNTTGTKGLATGVAMGSSTIQATLSGITSNSSTLTITAATLSFIAIGGGVSIDNGASNQYSATGTYSDGSTQDLTSLVTWNSASTSVATISNAVADKGIAYGIDVGTSGITATLANGVNGIVTGNGGTVTSNTSTLTVNVPNTGVADTTAPYLAIATDITASGANVSTILVKFSESVQSGGGVNAADLAANYTVSSATIGSVVKVTSTTYKLVLTSLLTSGTQYTITADNGSFSGGQAIKDIAGNSLSSPNVLTFIADDEMRIIQAEASSTSQIKIYYSRLVASSGTGSGACADSSSCAAKYYINPSLGTISSVSVSDNVATFTISGSTMRGIAYTIIAANGIQDDPSTAPAGFDTGSTDAITDLAGSKTLVGNPKDRISFTGKGTAVNDFADGWYMSDPFADGSVFAFTFKFKSKVYVGPNMYNNTTLRFDTDGSNVVSNTYKMKSATWKSLTINCPSTTGFGYGFDGSNNNSCDRDGSGVRYSGGIYEEGLVGYTSLNLTGGDILAVGPMINNATNAYVTQDTDNQLDMMAFALRSFTGGGNTKSIQAYFSDANNLYMGHASDHGTQAPILVRMPVTFSSGNITNIDDANNNSNNLNLDATPVGKPTGTGAGYVNAADAIGVDSFTSVTFSGQAKRIYIGNSVGIASSTDLTAFGSAVTSEPAVMKTLGQTNLVLPGIKSGGSYPEGLTKVSPGQRGVPFLKVHNGKLYAARNVSLNSSHSNGAITEGNKTPNYAEVYVCSTPSAGTTGNKYCNATDWSLVFTTNSAVSNGTRFDSSKSDNIAISMFEISPTGMVYLGFDSPSGFRVYRNAVGTSSDITNTGWTQEGPSGSKEGFGDATYNRIQSSVVVQDKNSVYYTYITVGGYDTTNLWHKPIQVYRQADDGTARVALGDFGDSSLMAYISKTASSDSARAAAAAI
ncbi:MAG TPA: Ig-like domain-containing protein, partial [Leptospiraceae bacterium]|nr:Ig-like domain-containing protein [Leptospiraceae bacterium]